MLWLRNNAVPLMIVGSFFVGAMVNGWYRDAESYKEASVQISAIKVEQDRQGRIGAEWQRELRKLAKSRGEVIREVQTIIDRPVYSAECIDADGVRLANESKNGSRSGAAGGVRNSTGSDGDKGQARP